ncbi:hypothetical protein [Candidatus Avelusimicrobium luingense]|uniref:hypothetical protein n=1 Tax=Candidatus Avelusimicrobium luingense TaxID=3416211 RepID=UPI003D152215
MRIGKWNILPWNKYNVIPRIIIIILVLGWFFGSIFAIYNEYRILRELRQEREQQIYLQQERIRRQAAYERQILEEQSAREGVQNAVDSFRRQGE